MTKQEATQECEEIEGALLDSFYTSSIQKDQSLRDVLSRGIWVELPLPEAADVCHVLIGNESFITTNITNCDSRHNFICMRNYPDSFKIDGGCVEERRRSQERCPIENVYYNEGYLSWVASPRFYQHMTTTIFHILVRPGYQIRINFASINLRIDDKLSCVDSLELVENFESSQSVKGMYCGDIKKLILQLETNNVTLSLKIGPLLDEMSDQLYLHAYFEGLNCTLDDCTTQCPSEPFTKSFGEIFTYNFPAALSKFFECAWTIIVSNGFYIRVDFTYLDISCSLSSLVIYDLGNDFESDFSKPPKYDLCGHQGISLVSSGNMLRIDLRNLGKGSRPVSMLHIAKQNLGDNEGRFFAIYKKESFVANTLPSREDAYCEKGWTLSSNDCYRVVQSSGLVTWLEAQETCQDWSDESSYLVVIHSQLEMDFVQELILKTGNPELGTLLVK
ncbi:hypothetical protein BSL78_23856 [Apostichopus japonicus]|uniref:CUB domain-containing protein n=1 Tax=Stichopus japonicus TaxID=307972 RepID=A0A2G8JU91_STIJA|nr:hypothetical protein BSL78_23856 [Apostichopus japonicus]